MSDITTVGLDLAKNAFQVHGANGAGRALLLSVVGMFKRAISSTRH